MLIQTELLEVCPSVLGMGYEMVGSKLVIRMLQAYSNDKERKGTLRR